MTVTLLRKAQAHMVQKAAIPIPRAHKSYIAFNQLSQTGEAIVLYFVILLMHSALHNL